MPAKPAKERSGLAALKRQAAVLRRFALTFPEAVEEFPWGEHAFKVKKKVFTFLSLHNKILHVTVKLPETGKSALTFPFAAPTGYGLGKNGWVTANFDQGDVVPIELIQEWIEESYRAIAPAKLSASLDGQPALERKKKKSRRRKS